MKKNSWKKLVLGMVLMVLLVALAVPALATTGKKTIEVDYMDIHLHVDGIPVALSSQPFVCEGTTYLPVRAVGEALGKDVRWDGPTHTIYITDPAEPKAMPDGSSNGSNGKKTIEVNYLDIKLVVDGKEVTPKDANGKVVEPFAYNGTTYLPVRAVGEALGKTVRWDGETKTVHLGELPQATYLVDVCKTSKLSSNTTLYRAVDHKAFTMSNGKRFSQGFSISQYGALAFELGGRYESLTFDLDSTGARWSYSLEVWLDGEFAQEIKVPEDDVVQAVTVPLNYAQIINFKVAHDNVDNPYMRLRIANAVLNGERTVTATKPVPSENATYLADICEWGASYIGKKYKAAEGIYKPDIFGNKYTNGVEVFHTEYVDLNGRYKTLKATAIGTSGKGTVRFCIDGETVGEITVSTITPPQTIEIPLNYGLQLEIDCNTSVFLADAILE